MKNKKTKAILLASACAVFVPLLAACSQTQETPDPVPESNVSSAASSAPGGQALALDSMAQEIISGLSLEGLEQSEPDMAMERIYGLTEEEQAQVEEVAVYVGTGGASADEVSVWRAKDADGVTMIQEKIQGRIDTQKANFTNYQPQEMPKLENPCIVTQGNTVVLVIAGNSDEAASLIEGMLG